MLTTQRHTLHHFPKIDPRRLGTIALYLRSDKGAEHASGSVSNVQDWVDQSRVPYTFEQVVYENKYGTNMGFEVALGAEWVETITATGTTARDATVAKYGAASLKLVMTDSTASGEVVERAQTFADIDAAEVWSYQIWVRIDELTLAKVVLLVDYTGGAPDVSAESTSMDGTKFVVLTLSNQTAPASTTAAVVRIRIESTDANATGTVYVDGVMVVPGASLPNIYSQGNSIKNSFDQRTTASQPVVTPAVFKGKPGIKFEGTDDLLKSILGTYLVGSSGLVMGLLRLSGVVSTAQALLSSSDEGSTGSLVAQRPYQVIGVGYMTMVQQDNGDVADLVRNGDTPVANKNYLMSFRSTGAAYSLRINGQEQTLTVVGAGGNTGDWYADTTLRDNTTIGGTKWQAAEVTFLEGYVGLILVFEGDPGMGARIKQLERMIRQRGLRALR